MARKRPKRDPEQEARWERERREMAELLERRLERTREIRVREARRRERIRRLTFGLLARRAEP